MAKTGKSTNHPKLTLYSTLKTDDESCVVEEAEAGRFMNLRSVWSIDRVISGTAKAIQKNPVDGVGDKKKKKIRIWCFFPMCHTVSLPLTNF